MDKPAIPHDEFVYSNFDHVIRWDVVDTLAHDQSQYAQHAAKDYRGYVFAITTTTGAVRWFEEVWRYNRRVAIAASDTLEQLLMYVTEAYGYA